MTTTMTYTFFQFTFPTTKRPDILLYSDSLKLVILSELTCPMEEGMEAARIRKIARYKSMTENIPKFSGYTAELFTVEVGARGFVRSQLRHWLRKIGLSNRSATSLCKAISGVSARCSFVVYLARSSKSWTKTSPSLSHRTLPHSPLLWLRSLRHPTTSPLTLNSKFAQTLRRNTLVPHRATTSQRKRICCQSTVLLPNLGHGLVAGILAPMILENSNSSLTWCIMSW